MQTVAGAMETNRVVHLEYIILPEFDKSKRFESNSASIFDAPCNYDIIFGQDFLNRAGIDISYLFNHVK